MGKLEKAELYIDKYFEKNNAETFAFCTDGFYYDGASCIVFFFPLILLIILKECHSSCK